MMNTSERKTDDRVLGDEWEDWNGAIDENLDTRKSVFFIFAGLLIILLMLSGLGVIYLISPRLEQLYIHLPDIFYVLHGVFSLYILFTYITVALAILTEHKIWLELKRKNFIYNFFVPLVLRTAEYFGISKDKISNSFIKVNNAVTRLTIDKLFPGSSSSNRILILLPRCLQKDILKKLISLKEQYNVAVHTVAGGTQARAVIKRIMPRAVIGVACERDLLSGIKDVAVKIPVIGVVNKRPEGPCKQTIIDIDEVIKAITLFQS